MCHTTSLKLLLLTALIKKGQKCTYSCTARVDRKAPLQEVFRLLNDCAQRYIIHRFFVINARVFWQKFWSQYVHTILIFDYSENIQLKLKFEAESAHSSGKQQTLHCCVRERNGDIKYLYHLLDDKHHDSVITFAVIDDIIENDPTVIENGNLMLRSDDCPTQYKSKFVFHKTKLLLLSIV